MARIKSTGGHSWVEVLPGDDGYDDATDIGNVMMVTEGADAAGRNYGGRSAAGVEDADEDEAQVSTGITQFGLAAEGAQRGNEDFVGYTGTDDSLGDPTGTPSTGAKVPKAKGVAPEVQAARITAAANAEADRLRREENLGLRQGAARDVMGSLLRDMFGDDSKAVSALTTQLNDLMIKGATELEIVQKIRGSDQYATRFPGMAARAKAGMPAISEREYIDLERNYRNLMRTSGIDDRFYKDPERFGELIAGDVSAAELQTRIGLAEEAVDGADPVVREQLERFYGIDRTKLVEYYLDPVEEMNLFEEERRLQAAGLSAASLSATGQAFDKKTAEALERENVQRREVQQRLSQRAGLTERLLGEEEALTASELAQGEFGLEAGSVAELGRRREERMAGFSGSSGLLAGRGGVAGLGSAD
jgi:hypothetical protein